MIYKKVISLIKSWRESTSEETAEIEYYDEEYEFNTKWVTLNYQGSTAAIIRSLHVGDPILLQWVEAPFREGEHIKVLSSKRRQIGWVPACINPTFVEEMFIEAVKNHWPVDARVKRTGKVSGKDIWWCVVSVEFKVQYVSNGDEVYMALHNNRYHFNPECGDAQKKRVPLNVALRYGRIPCPKCALPMETDK